ncbi:MAG: hypothetical protein KC503_43480 [Myxococcales bacterium]|nr:hypothetical protein [Myxococcales bacterium]
MSKTTTEVLQALRADLSRDGIWLADVICARHIAAAVDGSDPRRALEALCEELVAADNNGLTVAICHAHLLRCEVA